MNEIIISMPLIEDCILVSPYDEVVLHLSEEDFISILLEANLYIDGKINREKYKPYKYLVNYDFEKMGDYPSFSWIFKNFYKEFGMVYFNKYKLIISENLLKSINTWMG